MNEQDVRVRVSAEADTSGLQKAQAELDKLREKAAQAQAEAAKVRAQGDFVADRSGLESRRLDLGKLRSQAAEAGRYGDTKGAAKFARQADTMERSIDREGERLLKVEDAENARRQRVINDAEKSTQAVERAEEKVTREQQRQNALRDSGIRQQQTMVGTLARVGVAMVGMEVVGELMTQARSQEDLGLRKQATSSRHAREEAVMRSPRGSSSQMAAAAWAAEDDAAELKRQRPQMANNRWWDTLSGALTGGAAGGLGGAIVGAATGPGALLTGTIGAVVGAGIGGWKAWNKGSRDIAQNEQDAEQEEGAAERRKKMARDMFMNQEGGLQLDSLRARNKGTLQGQREAFVNDMAQEWLGVYRDVYNKTAGDGATAKEMADLTVQNSLRDKQAAAGAGLVDAHTGGAGIAAAAAWAQQTGGWGEVAAITGRLESAVVEGNQNFLMEKQSK